MNESVIASVDCWVVRVPLLEQWASSPEFGPHVAVDERALIRLRDSDGFEGWGEAVYPGRERLLDATLPALPGRRVAELRPSFLDLWPAGSLYWQHPLAPSPHAPNLANLQHRLRHPLQTILEMALSDLSARRLGTPMCNLFGGAWRRSILVDYWVGRSTPEHARRCTERARQLGFAGIKIKTSLEDPNVERLEAIRDAGGEEFKVTVDANGRFHRLDDALPMLLEMDRLGNVGIFEDPFPRFHLGEFAELRRRVRARVVVHIDPPESLWNVLHSGAAGGLNIDSHTQGLFNWRVQAGAAEQANLPVWHGSAIDLGIYTAAQLHLAASAPNCQLPGDQVGPWLRQSHLLKQDFKVVDGRVLVPDGPGLGVEVDLHAVEKYLMRHQRWPA